MASDEKHDEDKTRPLTALTKGLLVGHYRIIEKIGAGGMGEVYLAEDTELNRKVALKFLPPHLCQDADCRARFKREAQAAAKLGHSNIVAIHEVGEHQGRPFFAMELVEGRPLDKVIASGHLNQAEIVELALGICNGLRKAHESGVIHRDIKPSNIVVDHDNVPRILDFGLAVVRDSDRLTQTGSTAGTIGYMSPEQIAGRDADARSDLFSFGVVLYEMITGVNPFRRDNQAATLKAISEYIPEPMTGPGSDITDELQRIVNKLLEKKPEFRYQTAADLGADLRKLTGSTPAVTPHTRILWYFAALIAIVIIGGLGITYFLRNKTAPDSTRKMLAVLPLENIGPTEQEYFADGLTDEITTKLCGVSGLRVIAQSSASTYKKTSKTIAQIGKELGADFLLQGTIRWQQMPDGRQRLRVNPRLVQVSDGSQVWSQSYEDSLAGVFGVQADIATQVAQALGVALLSGEQRAIEQQSTSNTEAYESYLRGLQLMGRSDREAAEEQCRLFQKAADLDPDFVAANYYVVRTLVWLYFIGFGKDKALINKARNVVDKVVAFHPTSVYADLTQGCYYYWGLRDYDRALEYFNNALSKSSSNSEVLAMIAYVRRRQGHFVEALDLLRRSLRLDPRSLDIPSEVGFTFLFLRDYSKAEEYFRRSCILRPEGYANWENLSLLYVVWHGDIKAAREVLKEGIAHTDSSSLAGASSYMDILTGDYVAANEHLIGLLKISNADTARYYLGRAWTARLSNRTELAKVYFDSLRTYSQKGIKEDSLVYIAYSNAGLAYAGLGLKDTAIALGKKGVELMPLNKDATDFGPDALYRLALVYATLGESDAAIAAIERLLTIPSPYSANSFRLEPYWTTLRGNPRFQKLLEKYGT
jgi:serine/threonine protein kinase/Tfp pilus assembly protein PilF